MTDYDHWGRPRACWLDYRQSLDLLHYRCMAAPGVQLDTTSLRVMP